MHASVLGLGEAGGHYAEDLAAAGWHVVGYDPADTTTPHGVLRADSAMSAVKDAEIVLSFTGTSAAVHAASEVGPRLRAGACFADFNSAAPEAKRSVASALSSTESAVADVAVLAPVPRAGAATPLLVSGGGASTVAMALRGVGAPVEQLAGPVGAAAGRKLLRSVFMKGLGAVVLESVEAGRAAGCEGWVREQIAGELGPNGSALVERLITGTRAHAGRRWHEVSDARDYLLELGADTAMCDGALRRLDKLVDHHEPD